MIWHTQHRIDTMLSYSDADLQALFDANPADIREQLEDKQYRGEVYVTNAGCEGFDPVTGCPGHPSETDSITKQ